MGQPVLPGTPVKNWRILLEQSFSARMPLLVATSAFRLGMLEFSSSVWRIPCPYHEWYKSVFNKLLLDCVSVVMM